MAASNVEQGRAFVKVLAAVLSRLVETNDAVSVRPEVREASFAFLASRPPTHSPHERVHEAHVGVNAV
jgi:plasmid stabilization system protein ParE